jgi:CheY-like chemotaxis protein
MLVPWELLVPVGLAGLAATGVVARRRRAARPVYDPAAAWEPDQPPAAVAPPRVVTASSAKDALVQLSSGRVDVLVIDAGMPEIEGMALARLLSRFAEPPQVVFRTDDPDTPAGPAHPPTA